MTEELALLESFSKSRLWKWTREYLLHRREQLFNVDVADTNQLWKNRGAILEINRLLKAPQLVLEYYRRQQAAETRFDHDDDFSAPLPAANRSEFPD